MSHQEKPSGVAQKFGAISWRGPGSVDTLGMVMAKPGFVLSSIDLKYSEQLYVERQPHSLANTAWSMEASRIF